MKFRLLLLCWFCVSCQFMRAKPAQSSEIVKQSSNKEKIEPLAESGGIEGVVSIKVKNQVYLQDHKDLLDGCVIKGNESYLNVYSMTHVEIEGRRRLKVKFSKHGEEILLPIVKRFKSGKVKVETIITINDKSLKAQFYTRVGQKEWDVSLGRHLLEHNYKVIGRVK
jgi:hypothetical protein